MRLLLAGYCAYAGMYSRICNLHRLSVVIYSNQADEPAVITADKNIFAFCISGNVAGRSLARSRGRHCLNTVQLIQLSGLRIDGKRYYLSFFTAFSVRFLCDCVQTVIDSIYVDKGWVG
ncbi:hypothetical protein D3C73_1078010 [compost metagenome]